MNYHINVYQCNDASKQIHFQVIVTALHWNTSAAFNLPVDPASCLCEERMRGNWIATSLVALAHGIPFFHAGGHKMATAPTVCMKIYWLYWQSAVSYDCFWCMHICFCRLFAHLCLYELILAYKYMIAFCTRAFIRSFICPFMYCFLHCSLQ